MGEGPENASLQQQFAAAGLSTITDFLTPLPYPQPFLDLLTSMDIVLLTNLNDQQPRLIFCHIARMPSAMPRYAILSWVRLLREAFYQQGNSQSLARAIDSLCPKEKLRAKLPNILDGFLQLMRCTRSDPSGSIPCSSLEAGADGHNDVRLDAVKTDV